MSLWKQEPIAEVREFQRRFPRVSEKFMDMLAEASNTTRLDKKTQELVILGLLAAQGFEPGFKFHLKEAVSHGATPEEIEGAILLTLPYCSISTFLNSVWWAKEEGIVQSHIQNVASEKKPDE